MPAPVSDPEQREGPEIPGEAGGDAGQHVDEEGDEEEPPPADPVGQPAEAQRARPPRRRGRREAVRPIWRRGEREARALVDGAGQAADQRHLQPVQHPGDAERDDDRQWKRLQGRRSSRAGTSVSKRSPVAGPGVSRMGRSPWGGKAAGVLLVASGRHLSRWGSRACRTAARPRGRPGSAATPRCPDGNSSVER